MVSRLREVQIAVLQEAATLSLDVVFPAFCEILTREQPDAHALRELAGLHPTFPVPLRYLR